MVHQGPQKLIMPERPQNLHTFGQVVRELHKKLQEKGGMPSASQSPLSFPWLSSFAYHFMLFPVRSEQKYLACNEVDKFSSSDSLYK